MPRFIRIRKRGKDMSDVLDNATLTAQNALLTQAIRRILEGKLEGADGAAGTLVALEGGQTSIDVQLGKDSGE